MGHRVKGIRERVDDIANDISKFNFIPRGTTEMRVENRGRETHSFVLPWEIVGRDESKEEIIRLLISSHTQEDLSVVAIVGVGGLGKTTLAQLVYNDERVEEYFHLRIWICVSDDFDVKILVKKILKFMGYQVVENLELDVLKNYLHPILDEKRYLLVLDDVRHRSSEEWNELRILLMVGAKGSKILVTTRNDKVASVMGIDYPFVLRGLAEDQSWDLFSKLAFRGEPGRVDPDFIDIGKEIVNMCDGVPLVIKTLGTILQHKTEKSQWLSIKNNSNLLSLRGGDQNILSVLKLSYDNLPIHLKQCFVYCVLFPKHYEIEKKLLVQLWMAQGYIQPSNENEYLEDIGEQYFEELLSRSLFEEVEIDAYNNVLSYKMHGLIHDLAQLIIKPEVFIVRDDMSDLEKARHVSLCKPLNSVTSAFKEKPIRTFFMLYEDDSKDDSIIKKLIPSCKCLRVLNLNGLKVKKMPKSISKLSHLRYLDLSYNDFEVLPSAITRLKNLQTLKVIHCYKLKAFPRNMRKLVNLRHHENSGCTTLNGMPSGLGELIMLQSLPLFVVGNGRGGFKRSETGSLSELKCLNHLRGELCIRDLQKVKDVELESKGENLKGKQYLQSLRLKWQDEEVNLGGHSELVMEGLQPHPNLKKLWIEGYGGRRFPDWMMNNGLGSLLPNLVEIRIDKCPRCQILPPFYQLPSLKFMWLYDLEEVEYMMEASSVTPSFPSLQILQLCDLYKLKGLCKREVAAAEQGPSFPRLSQLTLNYCPYLASLALPSSPRFSEIEIACCDNLASLLLPSSPWLSKLCIRDCSNLKSFLLPSYPCLTRLEIKDCDNLTSLLLPSFPCVFLLEIQCCYNLTSLLLSSFPCLSELCISDCPNLKSLLLPSSPCLSKLEIRDCDKLKSLLLPSSTCLLQLDVINCHSLTFFQLHSSPCLSSLDIRDCPNLRSFKMPSLPCVEQLHLSTVSKEVLLQFLFVSASSLKCLNISSIDDMTSLQEEVLQNSILEMLTISSCNGLATLPNWIGRLNSLTWLGIYDCPALRSLPEEMGSLANLQTLIISSCPHLRERCQRETGEDWPKIAHVPHIHIYGDEE